MKIGIYPKIKTKQKIRDGENTMINDCYRAITDAML
jgi:hypothetical protein